MNLTSIFLISFLFISISCSQGGSDSSPNPTPLNPIPSATLAQYLNATGSNVMKVSVAGSLCSSFKYVNEPCVAITICEEGTSNCQTIDNILLDTGSYGLRIFRSKINLNLNNVTDGSGKTYGTCATFGTGASWGYVQKADVVLGDVSLGGIKAPSVPFQVIDSTFANSASNCNGGDVDTTPSAAYFNGILGIGFFKEDCGSGCVNNVNNSMYYSCTSSSCVPSSIPLSKQVSNPIPKLNSDNNGYVLAFPDVSTVGSPSVDGVLILGIETRSNNQPYSGMEVLTANTTYGYMSATYKGTSSSGLIDSGTNGFAFADSSITNCSGSGSAFYCPASTLGLSLILTGLNSNSIIDTFSIANAYSLPASNDVFNNIGFELAAINHIFILGMPYFLGKSIFIGVEGGSSSLSNSIYWAY